MSLSLPSPKSQQQPNSTTNGEIQEINHFQRFDVVSDPSDHSYLNNNNNNNDKRTNGGSSRSGDCFTNVTSGVHKKIMQEWKILEKHLPDSIYVRVFETRIDLLRAVIVGAAGTPYHDGLYFFDIAFPSDYPTRPPFVCYKSFGLRINPNLYATGRVCLSLLNTWPGKKCEKWNSKESTVLQVLLSIQVLVLNERPYFNEPGNGMLPGRVLWERKSNAYSENVFYLSCKTMLYLLRRPPKNFESFVAAHFKERASVILSACNAYVNGEVRIGHYRNDDGFSCSQLVDVSDKFKGLMGVLYPELVLGFKKNGAVLGYVQEQLKVEKKTGSFHGKAVAKKNKSGVVRMVIGKLKKVLGLKKNKEAKSSVKKKIS